MSSWTARVEWEQEAPSTMDELEELVERLLPFHGALGMEKESAGPGHPEIWAAVITVDAPTLRKAVTTALQAVEQVTGRKATGVEVLAESEHERRTMQPTIPELVGYAEIAQMAGVTKQRAQQMPKILGFPMAVVETAAGPLRVKSQVQRFLEQWDRKPGRPRKHGADSAPSV